jgi:hypothetical protein
MRHTKAPKFPRTAPSFYEERYFARASRQHCSIHCNELSLKHSRSGGEAWRGKLRGVDNMFAELASPSTNQAIM